MLGKQRFLTIGPTTEKPYIKVYMTAAISPTGVMTNHLLQEEEAAATVEAFQDSVAY